MPMPIPVVTQVTPSVSLAFGTCRSIRPNAVMKVGEIATPLRNTASASHVTLSASSNGEGRQRSDADRDGKLALQRQRQPKASDDDPHRERPHGIDPDHQARGTGLAQFLGDRHHAHFGGREDRPDEDQRKGDDLHWPQHDRRSAMLTRDRPRLGLRPALQDQCGRSEG